MSHASQLRDSTQIVLPSASVDDLEPMLEDQFTVTIVRENDDTCRIIGSPTEIKAASDFLVRHGVSLE